VGGQRLARQDLGKPEHRVHRGADLVAHVGEEFALRRVRRFGRVVGPVQLAFVALAFADVADDPENLDEAAVRTEQRAGVELGPHRRAVSALQFEFTAEGLERPAVRQAGAQLGEIGVDRDPRVRRQHLGHRLAQRLGRRDAEQLLDRRADVGEAAVEIQGQDHVERVVGEQPVAFLADPQAFLHLPAGGDVLDDGQVAGRVLGIDLDRGAGHADPYGRAVGPQVAFVDPVAGDFAGIQLRDPGQVGGGVVRMGEADRIASGQRFRRQADDFAEAPVDLGDPAAARIDQHDAERRLLEDDAEARLGGAPGAQRGQFAAFEPPPPQQVGRPIDEEQADAGDQRGRPGHRPDAGVGLDLVDFGQHQPGRAGDRGGVGQHRDAAVVAAAGQDAVLALRGAGGRQVGQLERPGQFERGVRLVAQRRQEADAGRIAADQVGFRGPGRDRPRNDLRVQAPFGPPAQVGDADRRLAGGADRRQHAVTGRAVGVAVQVDEFDARLA